MVLYPIQLPLLSILPAVLYLIFPDGMELENLGWMVLIRLMVRKFHQNYVPVCLCIFSCASDITYFSAGVYDFDRSRTSFGRNFNISFHDIVYNNHTLSTMERLTVKNDHNWLQSK